MSNIPGAGPNLGHYIVFFSVIFALVAFERLYDRVGALEVQVKEHRAASYALQTLAGVNDE
jgi:hypothetical protein